MFIGHFAVGLASKRAAPGISLALLLLAPLLLDVLWPVFLLVGLETVRIDPGNTVVTPLDLHDYPWSHSLLMSLVWSALLGGGYFAWRRDRRGALVLAAGVFSHWVLDFVTHRPDMPLYPGSSTYVGLGLWSTRVGTIAVEGALFLASLWIYFRFTRAKDRVGSIMSWAFIGLLLVAYAGNMTGAPPPSVPAMIATTLIANAIIFPWAWWFDRHRSTAPGSPPGRG